MDKDQIIILFFDSEIIVYNLLLQKPGAILSEKRIDKYDSCNSFYKYDEDRIIFHRNSPKMNKIFIVDIF